MSVKDFEELEIGKLARDLTKQVYTKCRMTYDSFKRGICSNGSNCSYCSNDFFHSAEILGNVHFVVGRNDHADAFVSPVGRQNVLPVAGTVHPSPDGCFGYLCQ